MTPAKTPADIAPRYYVSRNRQRYGFRYSAYRCERPGAPVPWGEYLGGAATVWGARLIIRRDKRRIARGLPEQTVVWEG